MSPITVREHHVRAPLGFGHTILIAASLSLLHSPLLAAPSAHVPADEIHWTITGQASVTFDWRGSWNRIYYGLTPQYDRIAQGVAPSPYPFSSSGPYWEAKLTGLAENTVYHYSIDGREDRVFRTPPPRGSSGFTVLVMGDIGDKTSYENMPLVQSMIAAEKPALVLAVGDLAYGNSHGQAAVDQHFNDVMAWSEEAAYMPAWGNHEWDSPSRDDLRNYKGRFDLPNARTSPGSPAASCCGEDWYWFDYGNVRFIAYPEPWEGAWLAWRVEVDALMEAAEADAAVDFVVTFGHRPPYSSGHHQSDLEIREILDDLGARYSKYVLNLSGHSHNYERTHPQHGVVHLVVGIGGSSLTPEGSCRWRMCQQPSFSAFRALHHGAVRLVFTGSAIHGAALCGPPSGSDNDVACAYGNAMDRFSIPPQAVADTGPPPRPTMQPRVVPNPITEAGAIQFETEATGPARVEIFDVRGRRLRVLLDEASLPPGRHELRLARHEPGGPPLEVGLYFYRVRAGGVYSGRLLIID